VIAMLDASCNGRVHQGKCHMVRLFVRHKVSNYAKWRNVYNAFDKERTTMGVLGTAVVRYTADRNDMSVWHGFATTRKAEVFAPSAKLNAAMREAGVRGAPKTWFATEAL
jgi:hypothetical protein